MKPLLPILLTIAATPALAHRGVHLGPTGNHSGWVLMVLLGLVGLAGVTALARGHHQR
jgi:hypothetical protein